MSISRSIGALLAIGSALFATPALAAISSVTVYALPTLVGPPSQCPTKFILSARITGTAGQSFNWATVESINGAASVTSPYMLATIPPSGTFQGSFVIPVTTPTTTAVVTVGTQTVPQLSDLESASRTFSGTCTNATPAPAPTLAPTPAPIAAPSNLRPVQSAADCNALKGLLPIECASDVTAGKLQLIWDDPSSHVDAYDVYRVDGGRHDLVTAVKPGNGIPNPLPLRAPVDKPSGGYDNECFAVTATIGSNTSKDSGHYCYASGATATTETIRPSHTQSVVTWSIPQVSNCSAPIPANNFISSSNQIYGSGFTADYQVMNNIGSSQYNGSVGISQITVGYEASVVGLNYSTSLFSSCAVGELSSAGMSISSIGAIGFDLSHIKHHKIYSALLQLPSPQVVSFTSQKTAAAKFGHFTVSQGGWCSVEVGAASKEWWLAPIGNLQYDHGSKVDVNAFPLGGVDVAPLVSHWASNDDAGDYGFILDQPISEGANPIVTEGCVNAIGSPSLTLTYF